MSDLSVAGRIKQFDQRNGGNPAFSGEWFYYANGACREREPLGLLLDPPANEYDRLANIVKYHQVLLTRAAREFENLREQLMMSPHQDGEALDRLKQLQAVVGQRNAEVEQAKLNLANTEEGKRRESNRQSAAEQRQRQTQFREAVKSVRI